MASGFETPLDVAKHSCVILGVREITSFTDTNSVASKTFNTLYDKLRDRELERNYWRFSIKRAVVRPVSNTSFIFTPVTWTSGQNWAIGAVVAYAPTTLPGNGGVFYWQTDTTLTADTGLPDVATYWHRFAGNVVGDLWQSTSVTNTAQALTNNGYSTGEIVIVPADYAGGSTYAINDIVRSTVDGNYYVSLAAGNIGHEPSADAGVHWQLSGAWAQVQGNQWPNYVTGYTVWYSLISQNQVNPKTSGQRVWLQLSGTVANLELLYPIGTGPQWDLQTKNVYRLPYGWERMAPRYLFENDVPYLGADIGPYNDDWVVEGDYFISDAFSAIMVRFAADIVDVYEMHAMFCIGLAAEMAWHGCERITQSLEKQNAAKAAYEEAMTEARLVNAILEGDKKQPVSEYIAVRA